MDDCNFNRIALKLIIFDLFRLSCDVAANGEIAVEMFKLGFDKQCGCADRAYRIIFMDLNMPILDGFEASK